MFTLAEDNRAEMVSKCKGIAFQFRYPFSV
jgi:hypothetical protein